MSINKKDLIKRIGQKVDSKPKEIKDIVDATLEEIYQSSKFI